ncbi:hypothetical protein [Paenarthrobacter sp. PH39-S1]|uniref:hypothetical protein n=1 Tax=Paenarthrobacter sp. PH39-S1 TaxID=3046204 RepID=UPI0024B8AF04|nr:hypothetical protein [Paenarthrobacter sp. PH39-S1]MDJ0357862.1 hypothetical protein [Paenarthrobacter sp. PH39-S1]
MSNSIGTRHPAPAPGITRGHWTTVIILSVAVSAVTVLIGTVKIQLGPAAVVLFPII